jgi:peptide/nickel transport system ATP-binding protein
MSAARPPEGARAAARSAEASRSVLAAKDLRVELDGEAGLVRAIDGLSLAIRRGETFAAAARA